MTVFKVFVYTMALFGLSFIFSVIVGKCISYGYKRAYKPPPPSAPRYTVRWRDVGLMECAYTGTIRDLGDHHLVIEDENGWPVVVDKRDIIEVT